MGVFSSNKIQDVCACTDVYELKKKQAFIFNLIVSDRCYSAPLDLNMSLINLILAPFPYPFFFCVHSCLTLGVTCVQSGVIVCFHCFSLLNLVV